MGGNWSGRSLFLVDTDGNVQTNKSGGVRFFVEYMLKSSERFMGVTMKIAIFLHATLCSLLRRRWQRTALSYAMPLTAL